MEFEWDDAKRRSNLAKHKLDFNNVVELFDGLPVSIVPSFYPYEERFETTGMCNGRFITIIWTIREPNIRIISARSARDAERRKYRALYHG